MAYQNTSERKGAFSFQCALLVGVLCFGFFGEGEFGELRFLICFSAGFGWSVVLLNNLANLSYSMSRPQIFSSILYIALVLFFSPPISLPRRNVLSHLCMAEEIFPITLSIKRNTSLPVLSLEKEKKIETYTLLSKEKAGGSHQ